MKNLWNRSYDLNNLLLYESGKLASNKFFSHVPAITTRHKSNDRPIWHMCHRTKFPPMCLFSTRLTQVRRLIIF